jgi:hypothetical protein
MTPSSGARSGTNPGRGERGAGDGSTQPQQYRLHCGHWVRQLVEVAVKANGTKLYRCNEPGCGLQTKSWTQHDPS